jgi:hypothetical protein
VGLTVCSGVGFGCCFHGGIDRKSDLGLSKEDLLEASGRARLDDAGHRRFFAPCRTRRKSSQNGIVDEQGGLASAREADSWLVKYNSVLQGRETGKMLPPGWVWFYPLTTKVVKVEHPLHRQLLPAGGIRQVQMIEGAIR